jgi:hybrid cluster-associated redox disulfide protein
MSSPEIDPQIVLKELFTRWPATMPVFLRHHMICVGCTMSTFDTLAEAMNNYSLESTSFLTELMDAIDANPPVNC